MLVRISLHGQYYSLQVGDEATEALLEEVADSLEDASAVIEEHTFVVEAPSLTSRVRLYFYSFIHARNFEISDFSHEILVLIPYATSEGSGATAHPRSPTRDFTARIHVI